MDILLVLREGYDCFLRMDMDGYAAALSAAGAAVAALPERGALYGEWALVASLGEMRNIHAFIDALREAAKYLPGRSRVIPEGAELFGTHFTLFSVCSPQCGRAEENMAKLREAVALLYPMTGGGRGADVCARALLCFYRGELERARALAAEAFDTARQYSQPMCALCAADLLAQIAKHTGDESLWSYGYDYITAVADGRRGGERAWREMALVLHANLNLSLGMGRSTPAWLREGDFGAISTPHGYRMVGDKLCPGSLPNALFVQIQCALYHGEPCGDPVAALNVADAAQKVYGIRGMLSDIYFAFFRAEAYLLLGEEAPVMEQLRLAMALLVPDGLYLIACEFAPAFGPLLYDAAEEVESGAAARIRAMGENYWDKLAPFRKDAIRETPAPFTRREAEVAVLIAGGKSNAEIAGELFISQRTVEKHASNVFAKLNISRRTHVARAVEDQQGAEAAFWTRPR